MLWLYILVAIVILILAGFLLIRHEKQVNRRLTMELQEGCAKAYREGMIERGEISDADKSQAKSMREIIDSTWRKAGEHS